MLVLIDTWWNVNVHRVQPLQRSGAVLIDTWWNVNEMCGTVSGLPGSGFNRYMVECELSPKAFSDRSGTVLIDTWWNVNAKLVSYHSDRAWF